MRKLLRTRVRLTPYKKASGSAKALARSAGVLRLNQRTSFRPRPRDLIVNWGSHTYPNSEFNIVGTAPRYVNRPEAVYKARNKLLTFRAFAEHDVPTVEWTEEKTLADDWWAGGHIVMVRNTLVGQGGSGILVCAPGGLAPIQAPLYTKYFKKRREFRLHIWNGGLLDLQEKKKRRNTDVNYHIRNYDGGWVFTREGVACPQAVTDACVKAVAALGLDFGAVDVGWNEHYQKAAVFEVNTAPGIEGTTLERYASKIKELR